MRNAANLAQQKTQASTREIELNAELERAQNRVAAAGDARRLRALNTNTNTRMRTAVAGAELAGEAEGLAALPSELATQGVQSGVAARGAGNAERDLAAARDSVTRGNDRDADAIKLLQEEKATLEAARKQLDTLASSPLKSALDTIMGGIQMAMGAGIPGWGRRHQGVSRESPMARRVKAPDRAPAGS